MSNFDNTNRGAIWKNDDKQADNHPDYKGSLNINGVEYWVSAWKRKPDASDKSPALSFTVKPKEEKQQQRGSYGESKARDSRNSNQKPNEEFDDLPW